MFVCMYVYMHALRAHAVSPMQGSNPVAAIPRFCKQHRDAGMVKHAHAFSDVDATLAYFALCQTRTYLLRPFDSALHLACDIDARRHSSWTVSASVQAMHLALQPQQLRDMLTMAQLLTSAQSATLCVTVWLLMIICQGVGCIRPLTDMPPRQ
jgi:hypothetical protein